MGTLTMIFSKTLIPVPEANGKVILQIGSDGGVDNSKMWREIEAILDNTLVSSGLRRPGLGETSTGSDVGNAAEKILVAPGVLVRDSEYKQRFEGIDLELYRKQMPEELFKAFIRHIGSVSGKSKIEVVELTSNFED